MYKVLIVDDDVLIVQDIISLIKWEMLFCEVPDFARDGELALKKMETKKYDIVITDVSMPRMNGVDLIKNSKDKGYDSRYIIISNFDDFVYVREAIKLGALDYMLKYQIDEENLKEVILKAIETLSKEEKGNELEAKVRLPIKKSIDYMLNNFQNNVTLEEVAEIAEMSPSYYSRIFKEETGKNYNDFLRQIRISKAKTLLVESSLKINEIALAVGIADYHYFSRIFKEETGMTCGQYRKMYAK